MLHLHTTGMTFSIFDTGNLVLSYDEEAPAREALDRIVHEEPEAVDRLLLVVFDDQGELVDEYVPDGRVPA